MTTQPFKTNRELENRVKSLSQINTELRRKNALLKAELTKLQIKKQTYSSNVNEEKKGERIIFEAIKSEYQYFEAWMLATQSRKREYLICRQLFQSLMIRYKIASLKQIGMKTGGRDHSTIINSRREIDNLITTDKVFRIGYENIVKLIEQGLYTVERIGDTIS